MVGPQRQARYNDGQVHDEVRMSMLHDEFRAGQKEKV